MKLISECSTRQVCETTLSKHKWFTIGLHHLRKRGPLQRPCILRILIVIVWPGNTMAIRCRIKDCPGEILNILWSQVHDIKFSVESPLLFNTNLIPHEADSRRIATERLLRESVDDINWVNCAFVRHLGNTWYQFFSVCGGSLGNGTQRRQFPRFDMTARWTSSSKFRCQALEYDLGRKNIGWKCRCLTFASK